jgi:hypothetical protein
MSNARCRPRGRIAIVFGSSSQPQSAVRVLVERNGNQFPATAITIPPERADPYLVRIVKGLLTDFYPEFDYSAQSFEVDPIDMRVVVALAEHVLASLPTLPKGSNKNLWSGNGQ